MTIAGKQSGHQNIFFAKWAKLTAIFSIGNE